MRRHLNRSRKALLAIAEGECAYLCSVLGHGSYTYYSNGCCDCD